MQVHAGGLRFLYVTTGWYNLNRIWSDVDSCSQTQLFNKRGPVPADVANAQIAATSIWAAAIGRWCGNGALGRVNQGLGLLTVKAEISNPVQTIVKSLVGIVIHQASSLKHNTDSSVTSIQRFRYQNFG